MAERAPRFGRSAPRRTPVLGPRPAAPRPSPIGSRPATAAAAEALARRAPAVGLVAGVLALAAGGVALGLELERRIVSKRILRADDDQMSQFFQLRAEGISLNTPDGVVLHAEIDDVEGTPTEDLTIVFVHGYALSLDCFHFQRAHYRGRVRQVLYDQRSHGRSSRSEGDLCRIPQLATDLLEVLDELAGPGPLVLVGHSMGGMTIMRLAQTHPELFGTRIRGVAFFSTAAGEMADYSPIRGLPGRTFTRIAPPLLATLNRVPELVERSRKAGSDLGYVVTKRMAFGSDVDPSYVEFVSEMLGETSLEVVADFYPAFAELDEYKALAHLRDVEVSVIGGEDDMITPIERTARMIELLPHADALRLAECGHLGMIEHHAIFNEVLDGLLDRVRSRLSTPPAR